MHVRDGSTRTCRARHSATYCPGNRVRYIGTLRLDIGAMGMAISPRGSGQSIASSFLFCRDALMSAPNTLSSDMLIRLVGRPDTPVLIDVRSDEDAAADPRLAPGAMRRRAEAVANWAPALSGVSAVVLCAEGHARSEGVAAWLRAVGASAEILEEATPPGARRGAARARGPHPAPRC